MDELSKSTENRWLRLHTWPDAVRPLSLMDRLFNRLDGTYPHKFRSAFANSQAIQNWRDAWADKFLKLRLTPAEVSVGMDRCSDTYDWPPSLPEFIKLCRPMLDPELAFCEAVEQMRLRADDKDVWSSPVIYWAAAAVGDYTLFNRPYADQSKSWGAALVKADEQIRAGVLPDSVPVRLVAIPAPGRTTPSDDQVAENLAILHAIVGGSRIGTAIGGME